MRLNEIQSAPAPLDPTFARSTAMLRAQDARLRASLPFAARVQIFVPPPGSREARDFALLKSEAVRPAAIPQKAAARFLASLPDVEGEKLDADLAALSDYAAEHALRS